MSGDDLVAVHLRGVPVPLWARSQEHSDELIREFVLIANEQREGAAHDVPKRLTNLIDELTEQYSQFSTENEQRLADAALSGEESIDLVYTLPVAVADAAEHLGQLLDEADDYCRQGQHLLTLETPPDLVRFRHWFLDEIRRQVIGEQAITWADYRG